MIKRLTIGECRNLSTEQLNAMLNTGSLYDPIAKDVLVADLRKVGQVLSEREEQSEETAAITFE